jgi:hypothetical protein
VSSNLQVDKYVALSDEALEEELRFNESRVEIMRAVKAARKNKTWDKNKK